MLHVLLLLLLLLCCCCAAAAVAAATTAAAAAVVLLLLLLLLLPLHPLVLLLVLPLLLSLPLLLLLLLEVESTRSARADLVQQGAVAARAAQEAAGGQQGAPVPTLMVSSGYRTATCTTSPTAPAKASTRLGGSLMLQAGSACVGT